MTTSRTFSYMPLWKLLIDKDLNKTQFKDLARLSPATMAKLGNCGNITANILTRIREVLDCNISGIYELVPIGLAPKSTATTEEQAHVATH